MNRRSFLKFLGIGTATAAAAGVTPSLLEGFVVDPEHFLWKPGEKAILLPPEKTFHLYTASELEALERALGVVRFYDTRGRVRLDRFDGKAPHATDKLTVLSDQEVRLAIETGFDLDPRIPEEHLRGGAVDWRTGKNQRMYTDRGVLSTHLTQEHSAYVRMERNRLAAGRYLDAYGHQRTWSHPPALKQDTDRGYAVTGARERGRGRVNSIITTERTDRGLVVIGHKDRGGM